MQRPEATIRNIKEKKKARSCRCCLTKREKLINQYSLDRMGCIDKLAMKNQRASLVCRFYELTKF
jgi:hypothetical protein